MKVKHWVVLKTDYHLPGSGWRGSTSWGDIGRTIDRITFVDRPETVDIWWKCWPLDEATQYRLIWMRMGLKQHTED